MLARHFGPRTGPMITGVTGIICNCSAAEAETHSESQRNREKEGREGGRNESRKIYFVLTVRIRYEPKKKFHTCGSFPRHYFSSISLPLPTVDAGTRQFPLIHHYIIILQLSNNLSSTTLLF